ncbi:MAG: beta-galactosidase GalB [Paludibacteraceae bacterium]
MTKLFLRIFFILTGISFVFSYASKKGYGSGSREIISINEGWSFFKYDKDHTPDNLIYDVRPVIIQNNEYTVADARPTEALKIDSQIEVLKPWILPTANKFIKESAKRHVRPEGNPGMDFPFVQDGFDDSNWIKVNLPHDWAINGPFFEGENPEVGGGMGRLPVNAVAWYRKKTDIQPTDSSKSIFLDFEGVMSYAMVWVNGFLAGGWPYGYNSWRVDITPYVHPGSDNQIAVRVDNPNNSSRWYPGGGIYRNVWLVKTNPVHIGQWGTYITAKNITKSSATIDLEITIDNDSKTAVNLSLRTSIYELKADGTSKSKKVIDIPEISVETSLNQSIKEKVSVDMINPKLWGPPPSQKPNLYLAVTTLSQNGKIIDRYETTFGIRELEFNPDKGLFVNGEHIKIQGVNQHHDLGALGAAFNVRAAKRQLELLQEMGCNAIRMAHNPPSPELLKLTDRMGFLVVNEIFDSWERKKTPLDFHLVFPEWAGADTRSFVRRDRNHPSVIMWSFGNEVGEQYTGVQGAKLAAELAKTIREEDSTRTVTLSMNYAKPDMEISAVPDIIGLNYQGEGIRQEPEFEGTDRIRTAPQYNAFHEKFPGKMIFSSETASAFSSRGIYLFPVTENISSIVRDGKGGDSRMAHVSSYELYAVDFGSSADKVFRMQDQHPFVAGEFVWTGWDYLGEPTPYYSARNSYCGIIDLAGFKKDRFYLYQSRWRPGLPMVHILPHWNWPERVGEITPVHVFTSGDEVELFLNGNSLGKKKRQPLEYRLRWDNVKYEAGELKAIAYKSGKKWAETSVKTTGKAVGLTAEADHPVIKSDGNDLSFITIKIVDKDGLTVPLTNNLIRFSIEGPGEIVATDNGNPTDFTPFNSHERNAFNGLCLVIVKEGKGQKCAVTVYAESDGLKTAKTAIKLK